MNRRSFIKQLGLAALGLGIASPLRRLSARGTKHPMSSPGGTKMAQARALEASQTTIPPIDANAPAHTHTATFALG